MIEKIAALIAAAVVPKVIELLKPYIEQFVQDARANLHKSAEEAARNVFTALDHNKDGKVDLKDLFNR